MDKIQSFTPFKDTMQILKRKLIFFRITLGCQAIVVVCCANHNLFTYLYRRMTGEVSAEIIIEL